MASSIKDQSENVMERQEEMLKVYDRKARMLEKKVRHSMMYRVTQKNLQNLLLTPIRDVPPSCLGSS